MKTFHLYLPIQKLSRGGVKTALLIIFSLAFLLVSSCDIFGPKTGDNEQTQENQQPSSSSQTPSGTDNPNPNDPNPDAPNPDDKNESQQQKITNFAELLSQQEKTAISELSSASLFESIESISILTQILSNYTSTNPELLNSTSDYISIQDINNAFSNNDNLKIDLRYFNKTLPDISDENKEEFPKNYSAAVKLKAEYEEYQAGEYTQIYNNFKPAFTNLSKPNYDKLEKYVADILKDFQDNYKLDKAFSVNDLNDFIQAAQSDIAQISFGEYKDAYYFVTVSYYEHAMERIKNYENPKVITLTPGDEYNYSDIVSQYQKVNIALPPQTKVVDVFEVIDYAKKLSETLNDGYYDCVDIGFAEYPESVETFNIDFATKEAAGKSNTDLLNEYYTMYVQDKLTSSNVGKVVRTELIPGVEIVTFMDRWDDIDDKPWEFVNAFSVSSETKVQMPKNYSLSGTYKSGIIGDNVTLENLDSNTNISGNIRGKDSFSSVYDLFVKNKDASELPNMNVEFIRNNLGEGSNIYGYNIDTLIKKYFDNNKGNKLILNFFTGTVFDARDYLNGDSMYEGNTYKDNAYPLDINAALVMGSSIKNVKIEGTKKTDKNQLGDLENVVVSVSMSGITTSASGVVDFMDEAPAKVYGTDSFITFKKVSNTVNVQGGLGFVDASALSQIQANYIGNNGNNYYVRKLAKQSSVTFPGADVRQGIFTSIDGFGITKQQVEQNTNEDKDDPLEVSTVLPRDIKQSKMDLMRNILEDKQSTLLSFSDLPTQCHSRA